MYLLYCDETNYEKRCGDFFVYGVVAIDSTKAATLSAEIEGIRNRLETPRDYLLKFNPGPLGFSHDKFIELKRGVMNAAAQSDCRLLINLLLHDVAQSSEHARRFGINTLCYHFDCLLNRLNEKGIVLIDRFNDREIDAQLRERLAVGLTGMPPYGSELRIQHILGYHYAAIGQSHFCSVVDVILGSMRFAINAFTRQENDHLASAINILAQLAPLFYRAEGEQVHEISLWFSPKVIRNQHYREQYLALQEFLAAHGVTVAQDL